MSNESGPLRMAYVLLWFPLSSETFIFREVEDLRAKGVDILVYSMYGKALKGCSKAMRSYTGPVYRMGIPAFFSILFAFLSVFRRNPKMVLRLISIGLLRRMRNLESQLENTWCFFAGFLLARQCMEKKISLIHSSWANGPATAAWVASIISNIPFGFTGRAGDIYPPDGLLAEKAADALFIRANNQANVEWLSSFCPQDDRGKVKLVYNGLTFANAGDCQVRSYPEELRILAVGRFARTKGFPELFTAIARLRREQLPVSLTLIGDGSWRKKLEKLRSRLGLEDCIDMPGFKPNDKIVKYMESHAVMVVPSVIYKNGDRDGIPNVIMEALSRSMPVVATDVCGIGEVIHNRKTGFLVPQRDPKALANAIREIFENYQAALKMGEAGCQLVREMFDPQKNCMALKQLYEKAVSCKK